MSVSEAVSLPSVRARYMPRSKNLPGHFVEKHQAEVNVLLSPRPQPTGHCHDILHTAPLDQQGSCMGFSVHSRLMTRSDLHVYMSRAQDRALGSFGSHLDTLAQQHAPNT